MAALGRCGAGEGSEPENRSVLLLSATYFYVLVYYYLVDALRFFCTNPLGVVVFCARGIQFLREVSSALSISARFPYCSQRSRLKKRSVQLFFLLQNVIFLTKRRATSLWV